jgi:hypothetical protein
MKATRKQKVRKKELKRRMADDRKYAILVRLLNMYGIESLFCPLDWVTKADLLNLVIPGLEVVISDDSKHDPEIEEFRALSERAVDTRPRFSFDGQIVQVSLDDFYRGLCAVRNLIRLICEHAPRRKPKVSEATLARLEEARRKVAQFDEKHLHILGGRLACQLNRIANQYLRIDEKVFWYKIESNTRYPDRAAFRIVVGRKQQVPASLPVSDGRRKAYPCERTYCELGPRLVTWNPARLGIGSDDRDLPVFVSEHAISRLHERLPIAPDRSFLHKMMYDSLDTPRLKPAEGRDGFLVEAGLSSRKYGYFVVEVYAEFIFVRTFLFLTMQGTPEAKCLRQKLGLSRKDIEYFKLDSFYTLACSDLGEDPELRHALAACGCDYLLDYSDPELRLSWLKRYRDPFREEIGLPSGPETGDDQMLDPSEDIQIEEMIEYSRKSLKLEQGWIL